jgi:hypothetical protein
MLCVFSWPLPKYTRNILMKFGTFKKKLDPYEFGG